MRYLMTFGIAVAVLLTFSIATVTSASVYLVDSRGNCIDLGSANENIVDKIVPFRAYNSVPYELQIPEHNPPVTFNSASYPFEGIFVAGPVGIGNEAEDWAWWHRALHRGHSLDVPACDRHVNLSFFMTDIGNLSDNAGAFEVHARPTAWGQLDALPAMGGLEGALSIIDPTTGKVYVFGGGRRTGVFHSQTWELDPEYGDTWQQIEAGPTGPAERWYHSVIYDPNPTGNPRMVIFGGFTTTPNKYNDTWALDLTTLTWSEIVASGSVPPPCNYHSAIYDPDGGPNPRMVVYGGHELGSTTYALDLMTNEWTALPTVGGPGVRCLGGAAYYYPDDGSPQMIWFAGGYLGTYYDDLWSLDLLSQTWTLLSSTGQLGQPATREGLSMVMDEEGEKLIVFGGRDASTTFDDLWFYSLPEDEWVPQETPADAWPEPTALHCAAYDPSHHVMLVIGGGSIAATHDPAPVRVLVADFDWYTGSSIIGESPAPIVSKLVARAWPVPTTQGSMIEYELSQSAPVNIVILDSSGRVVRRLLDSRMVAGSHSLRWDGLSDRGRPAPKGVYFCRIHTGSAQAVRKIVTMD